MNLQDQIRQDMTRSDQIGYELTLGQQIDKMQDNKNLATETERES